jgi:hypothetical protein
MTKKPVVHELRAQSISTGAPTVGSPTLTITGYAPTVTVTGWRELADDHPVHALVGRMTVAWASFEHQLDRTIWAMLGGDEHLGASVTAQYMGPGPRFLTILALGAYHKLDAKLIGKVNALQQKTYSLTEERNRKTHDRWLEEIGSSKTGQFKAMPKGKLTFGPTEVDLADLEKLITSTRELGKAARDLQALVSSSLKSSRGK